MEKIIDLEPWRCQQVSVMGFIIIGTTKYYLKDKVTKKVDPDRITRDPGDLIASNGNFYLVLTTDQEKAKRSNLTAKNRV